MSWITLERAFRAVLRAHYPQAPHLADRVTLQAMRASFAEPRSPEEQAAHEADAMLKAAIIDGRIRLQGCLAAQVCGAISTAEVTTPGRISVFENTLHVRQGRTYHDVSCAAEDIAALIGNNPAEEESNGTPVLAPPTSPMGRAQRAIEEIRKDPSVNVDMMSSPALHQKVCRILKDQQVLEADLPSLSTVERADGRRAK
jgi:hypothetical protein